MAIDGNRLKELRKDARLTQEALGKKLGVIKQTVSSWENNISEPNSEILLNMASIFNVSVDCLLGREDADEHGLNDNDIAKRLKRLRESAHFTQQELADRLSISCSTLARYESENKQPPYQVLAQISSIFHVPTDYLLGVGVFENWDTLLENKKSVITQIIDTVALFTSDALNELDEMTFVRLVYAFDINLHIHSDRAVGISAVFPSKNLSMPSVSNPNYSSDEVRLISIYNSLSQDDKSILLGKALDLKRTSVAADPSLKKTGTDKLGK